MILGIMLPCLNAIAASSSAEDWSLPDSRIGTRTAPLLLLSRPDVQAELKLEPPQVSGVQKVIGDLTRRGLALRGKTGADVIAERRAIDQAQLDWLSENLSRNQLDRLQQIEIQWEGPSAMLSRPRVGEYLKLSDQQRRALAQILSERAAVANLDAARRRTQGLALEERAQALLSSSQRELWSQLVGSPLACFQSGPNATRDPATQRAGHTTVKP
ncbi:hypothetical protein [Aquisphaera insulae]|uniref:hypothetical protein n=1 Tax=Aquisphaera insulae TaxID=2712864 RepID=UPI0013EE10EA|nr:hypothetical protein [Aquisphaera insulae]